ncbi:MAG TPA: hypothetical protein VE914_08145 [Candidatus Angelobacter sp.]|nr:hypothetical protein [Candidatus Angelobacter sp.]
MRTTLIAAAVATAALTGCTFKSTTVRQAETPPPVVYQAPAPAVIYQSPTPTVVYQQPTIIAAPTTISYSVSSQAQYNQAAGLAADWCRAKVGTGARIYDTKRATSGDVVTFACVAS